MATIIENPADWRAADMEDKGEWVINLSSVQVAALDRALTTAKASGTTLDALTKTNFPLIGFDDLFADVLKRLEQGRGIAVIRGLPALNYTKDDLRMMYWGIGRHVGVAVSQSSKGDLLGDVMDFGSDVNSSTGRGYMSRQHLGFHTDTSDVVALMVLRPAMSGGLSMICSSLAIRNEIARTRPDLLEILYQPFYWSWKGQQEPGASPYYQQPIYSEQDGKFSSRYIKTHILSAHEDHPELPKLTDLQHEAMSAIDHMALDPKFHFSMMFEPGDIQFLNNHVTMHSRSAFQDYAEPDRRRHLLRMWLSVPNSRALNPAMAPIYRDQTQGAVRGGFPSRTGSHSFETVQARD
ncbi:TauD/TfdA family dioxygenase [Lichenicoccus sp.]|uniref:TauD/TfdA family dioxygenase n=1 Tax=Lichenicoccus sp. TaxID=2781899 RepID=UPI003D0E77CA